MDKKDILALIDQEKDELIDLCAKLLQIPSENPPGDSVLISDFIVKYLKDNGFEVEVLESDPRRLNLISSYSQGEGKELVFCGHSDTVPVGDLSLWTHDPFSGEIIDGVLYGRGASDMKCGLGGLMFAMAFIKKHNLPINGKISLVVVPDEETGSQHGVIWLFDNKKITGDGCIIAEPSGDFNPTIGQKGAGSFELTVKGVPGHGSLAPLVGKNAIALCMEALGKIKAITDKKIPVPAEVAELVKISQKNIVELKNPLCAEILERISFNIGTIKGGSALNVIADSCTVEVDCRLPFGITRDEYISQVRAVLDEMELEYTLTEIGAKSTANFTSANDPVCRAIVDNIAYVKNVTDEAYGILQWACSDARYFRQNNIPVLQYGPAELSTIHGLNEHVKVDKIVDCAKVYVLAALDFLR